MNFEEQLDGLIPKLDPLKRDPSAEFFYDLMSGALVWTDEKVAGLTVEEMGCLRAIFKFRTGLIVNKPDEQFRDLWEKFQVRCPQWIGFNPSRCLANEDVLKRYYQLKTSAEKYIDKIP